MKVYVERPLKGYAYSDGQEHEMPEEHAEAFEDAGRGYRVDEKKSKDYTVAELKDMDLSDKGDSFFEGDDRKTAQELR